MANLHRHPKSSYATLPIPPKLDRQHEKAWVLLIFPTCTQLIDSLQSHSRLTQPSVSPVPSPISTSSSPPPLDDTHCQVCQSPFDEHQKLLCDICNSGWYLDCLLPPLTTIPYGLWKCPLCLPRHLLPSQLLKKKIKKKFFQTLPPEFWKKNQLHAYS